jgi:hypothetical protein
VFGLEGLETRNCVVKTIYLRRRFEVILTPELFDDADKSLFAEEDNTEEARNRRVLRLYRRTVMELFILNR